MNTREFALLAAAFEAPFGELGQSIERDRGSVVASWPSVPVEVIRAAGFMPVFARSAATPTPAADAVLEPGVFPDRLHQLFEAALAGRLAHVAAIVLPRTSDPDYKAYLYLQELRRRGTELPPVLLLDLLQSGHDTAAYNTQRVRELFERLSALAGRRAAVETLRTQLARANSARSAARRIVALRAGRARLAGAEALPLLGAAWQLQPERYCALVERAVEACGNRPALVGPRVLLAGAPVDSAALHAGIESQHAIVVDEAGPFGNDAGSADINPTGDPCRALAEWYACNVTTPRLSGAAVARRVAAALCGIDAAVLLLPPCDARFGWDGPRLRGLFEERGIPHLTLEVEPQCTPGSAAQQDLRDLLAGIGQRPAVRHG